MYIINVIIKDVCSAKEVLPLLLKEMRTIIMFVIDISSAKFSILTHATIHVEG